MQDIAYAATVRRVHVYIDEVSSVRCPDCGTRLFDATPEARGGVIKHCHKCRDAAGNKKSWLFIFHDNLLEMMKCAKDESETSKKPSI